MFIVSNLLELSHYVKRTRERFLQCFSAKARKNLLRLRPPRIELIHSLSPGSPWSRLVYCAQIASKSDHSSSRCASSTLTYRQVSLLMVSAAAFIYRLIVPGLQPQILAR